MVLTKISSIRFYKKSSFISCISIIFVKFWAKFEALKMDVAAIIEFKGVLKSWANDAKYNV